MICLYEVEHSSAISQVFYGVNLVLESNQFSLHFSVYALFGSECKRGACYMIRIS